MLLMLFSLSFIFGCKHHHTELVIQGTSATCTKDGYTDKIVCSDCNEIIVDSQIIKATGHSEEVIPSILASCTKDGATEGKKCTVCDEILLKPIVIPMHHTERVIPYKAPTCLENGSSEGLGCENCTYIFVEPTVIPAGHTEEIIPRVEPDIGVNGFTEGKKCVACGEILVSPIEISLLSMEIDSEPTSRGIISCQLSLDKLNGEFSVYYADENKKRLDYYNALAIVTLDEENNTLRLDNLIIPNNCKYLIASNGEEYEYFVKIPEAYLLSEVNYTFGALSDVHYNRGDYFNGALDFLDNYGIDFLGISGDLTSSGEVKSLEKYNEAISDRPYKVYTTTGNHDAYAVESGNWVKYINTSITADNEVTDIGENGMDFVFIPKKSQDNVFIFLCQTYWYYTSNPSQDECTLLTEKQLLWLSDALEKYKDKNVFLFFHTFLSAPDGTQESAVGNLRNPGGYAYDIPFSYGARDEIAFRALMKEYKNVVFFSGHSHWMFELEKYNENLNYSSFDGEYCHMVHIPSVCDPRWIGENDTIRTSMLGKASEGYIVNVCDDAIILIPVDFLSQTFYTEYMKIIPLQ